jgi:hypothetical protein
LPIVCEKMGSQVLTQHLITWYGNGRSTRHLPLVIWPNQHTARNFQIFTCYCSTPNILTIIIFVSGEDEYSQDWFPAIQYTFRVKRGVTRNKYAGWNNFLTNHFKRSFISGLLWASKPIQTFISQRSIYCQRALANSSLAMVRTTPSQLILKLSWDNDQTEK